MVCILGMGDCGTTQTVENVFNMKSLTQKIFKQSTTNIQTCDASGVNIQEMKIMIGTSHKGCPITAGQTIKSSVECEGEFKPENIVDMKDEIANDLKQAAAQDIETKGDMFQTAKVQSDVSTKVDQEIQNIVDTQITTENVNTVAASSVNIQSGELTIVNCYDEVDFSQNITAQVTAKAITQTLTKSIMDSTVLNGIVGELETSSVTKGGGLGGVFESIGTMFSNMFGGGGMYVSMSSSSFLCVLVAGIVTLGMSDAGQNAIRTGANAGAKSVGGGF